MPGYCRIFRTAALPRLLRCAQYSKHKLPGLVPAFHHWQMDRLGMTGGAMIQFVLTAAVLAGPGADLPAAGPARAVARRAG